MEATSVVPQRTVRVRRIPIEPKMPKTVARVLMSDSTPLPVDIALHNEPEYSDKRFHADLAKASRQLDAMERNALKEHAQRKTRKFPG